MVNAKTKTQPLPEQIIPIQVNLEREDAELFLELYKMAKESIESSPGQIGNNIICKNCDSPLEESLGTCNISLRLTFSDGLKCKVMFI